MNQSLATYLHDHLAGANFAVELLEALRDLDGPEPQSQVARDILIEVQKDRQVLQEIVARVGSTAVDMKQAASWLAEKVARLKLQPSDPEGLGTFEAIEFLTLGIRGKLALWKALQVAASFESSLREWDYDHLSSRAEAQFAKMEACRLQIARTALAGAPAKV